MGCLLGGGGEGGGGGQTRSFLGEEVTGVIVVDGSYS